MSTDPYSVGHHHRKRPEKRLQRGHRADDAREERAVPDHGFEDVGFAADLVGSGGRTQMLASIVFPITPPVEFAVQISTCAWSSVRLLIAAEP